MNVTRERLIFTRYLWLAVDCSYLPIKSRGARPPNDPLTGPGEDGLVTELKEFEQGIWLPWKGTLNSHYDIQSLPVYGKPACLWNWTMTHFSLKPNEPESFFKTITFPIGAVVYELHDGKVTKKYLNERESLTLPPG